MLSTQKPARTIMNMVLFLFHIKENISISQNWYLNPHLGLFSCSIFFHELASLNIYYYTHIQKMKTTKSARTGSHNNIINIKNQMAFFIFSAHKSTSQCSYKIPFAPQKLHSESQIYFLVSGFVNNFPA